MKILIVGSTSVASLELSYRRAAVSLGHEVILFNPDEEILKAAPLGWVGFKLHQHIMMENWVRAMNRKLIILIKDTSPDRVIIFSGAKILYGTIATVKTISWCKVIFIWPDTPLNLRIHNHQAASLFDLCAIYSSEAMKSFRKLGFNNSVFVPLAGDPELHGFKPEEGRTYTEDISFVGMWRPEREKYMSLILESFPNLRIGVTGTYWKERCTDKRLKAHCRGQIILGRALGEYFNRSRINLNVIDDTNYPAANMRFFEIPTAGGLQLTSPCPEQDSLFVHRKHCLFFEDGKSLVEEIDWILAHEKECDEIRKNGYRLIGEGNTYVHRLQSIESHLST